MAPNNPCKGCKDEGYCSVAGQINRLALEEWIDDRFFACPDYQDNFYHGLEGVFA